MADREAIRRADLIEANSIRPIARALKPARQTVAKALAAAEPTSDRLKAARAAPGLGAYPARIDQRVAEQETRPRKPRATSPKRDAGLQAEGSRGSESNLRRAGSPRKQVAPFSTINRRPFR
ncbi:MAG: hypothetical protein M5U01_09170 [Ardenticatenaceae bacterium]|nr:hypothetical protein [Ardenticatenaceae bacterium]